MDGQYWGNYKSAVAELKRQKRLEEARDLLMKCAEAAETGGGVPGDIPNPWPTEQPSFVLSKLEYDTGGIAALESYERVCGDRPVPDKVSQRLLKARLIG